jgi:hypothetical protein
MQHKVQQTTHCDPIFNCTTCNPEVCSSAGCKTQHGSSSSSETSSSACACTTKSVSSLGHDARHPAPHMPHPVPQTGAYRGTTGKLATATHRLPECGRAARLCATSINRRIGPHAAKHLKAAGPWHGHAGNRGFGTALPWVCPECLAFHARPGGQLLRWPVGTALFRFASRPAAVPTRGPGRVALHSRHQQPLTRRLPSGLFFRLFSATSR